MADELVVFITASSAEEAKTIGASLVEKKLAACVSIIGQIRSIFYWEGDVCDQSECLLIVKSVRGNLDALIEKVQSLHSYDVPEIIALPIIGGSKDYLTWIRKETTN